DEEYFESRFSNTVSATTEKLDSPNIQVSGKSIKVSWDDDSEAADLVRYRVKDTTKWTVKKLKKDTTEFTFNGKLDTTYEIEVLLDQSESNLLRGTATVLAKPKLAVVKESITDTSFEMEVQNFNDTNLAENTMIATVTINGEDKYVFLQDDDDEQGEDGNESFIDIPGSSSVKVEFDKKTGIFSFSGLESNTAYKVSVAFMSLEFNFSTGSDSSSNTGMKIASSPTSNTVKAKTLVTPYEAPTNVQTKATSDTTIKVTWESSDAPKYTVEYSTDGEKWKKATTKAEGTTYTIEKLKGGTEYQVRVSATKDKQYSASEACYGESATTLPTPKLTLDKTSVTSNAFKMDVESLGYADVIYVMSNTFEKVSIYLDGGKGSAIINAGTGFSVSYEDGVLSFTGAPANTQQKVQISLATDDGVCTTSWSKAISVKTTKAEEMD
nr:fibronectin type III domain-containing protein [Thermoguttaceae bacterium]